MNTRVQRLFAGVVILLFIIGLIFLVSRLFNNLNQPSVATEEPTNRTIFAPPGGQPTIAPPVILPVTSIPAPRSGIAAKNEFGNSVQIGTLDFEDRTFVVYESSCDTNTQVELPSDGLVLCDGHFIGHLYQDSGKLNFKGNSKVTWKPVNDPERNLYVSSSYAIDGFSGNLTTLPSDQYDIVTCYESKPGNKEFVGNMVYNLK
jgi:hypothetical protein